MTKRVYPCVRCRRPAPKKKVEGEHLCRECRGVFRKYQEEQIIISAYNNRRTQRDTNA